MYIHYTDSTARVNQCTSAHVSRTLRLFQPIQSIKDSNKEVIQTLKEKL